MPDHQDQRILLPDTATGATDRLRNLLDHRHAGIVAGAGDPIPAGVDAVLACLDPVALRAAARWRDAGLPVVMLADAPSVEDLLAALRAGVFEVVPAADGDAALRAALARALATGAAQRQQRVRSERLLADNAELSRALHELREDEVAGHRIQQRILPASPQDFGWCRVEHRVKPALFLSGDFVDCFEVGDRCLAFYLADVSGHGASSAFVTLLLKTLGNRVRRELQRDSAGRRPSLLPTLVNRELLALGLGKHLTLCCGIIDFAARQLHWCMAGHYPQPVVFDGKCAHYLQGTGMPVGLFDDAVYEDRIHALPQGFTLLVLSDGAMELLGEGTLADKEARLLAIVQDGAVTVDALGRVLGVDDGRPLPDDIAMLVIRETDAVAGA